MHRRLSDEITYATAVEVLELICNFIPHLFMDVIVTDAGWAMLIKWPSCVVCDAALPVKYLRIYYLFAIPQLYAGFKSHHYVPQQLSPWLATSNKPRILDAGAGTGLVGEQVDPSVTNCNHGSSVLIATGKWTGKLK